MTTTQQNRTASIWGSAELCISYTVVQLMLLIVWQDGGSPLMEASQNGHVQVVAELIQHGARVDLQDEVWSFCEFVAC